MRKPFSALAAVLLLMTMSSKAAGIGGDFELTADDGSVYSLADSRGKVVVISFGYTFCPDVCPTSLTTIVAALGKLGNEADEVDPLFVSLDPDRDTPDRLRDYTRAFHPRLKGLTGEPEKLQEVADHYRVRYALISKGKPERYTLDHSANLYVVDARGELFRILPYGLPAAALANTLRSAIASNEPRGEVSVR